MLWPVLLIIFGISLAFVYPFADTLAVIMGLTSAGIGGFWLYRKFSRRRIM